MESPRVIRRANRSGLQKLSPRGAGAKSPERFRSLVFWGGVRLHSGFAMKVIDVICPAKVNLFLAITGRRSDGFHNLVSLMAPLTLGDRLRLSLTSDSGSEVSFHCDDESLPQGCENLALRALERFRECHPFAGTLRIELRKEIPVGAGLGGGSSDAAGMLLALNRLLGKPLAAETLHALASSIGSDCPFFLKGEPVVARGRGERISRLPEEVRKRLRGTPLLLVKPSFPVRTAWAYGAMARRPEPYCPNEEAEERLAGWLAGDRPEGDLLYNNLEEAVFEKYVPLAVLKAELERKAGLATLMSGSGSTLFALEREEERSVCAERIAKEALGDAGWVVRTRIG